MFPYIICKTDFQPTRSSLKGEWKDFVDCGNNPCNQGSYIEWNLKTWVWGGPWLQKENFHTNYTKLQYTITRNHRLSRIRSVAPISRATQSFLNGTGSLPELRGKKNISYYFRNGYLAGIHFTTNTASRTNSIALRVNFDLKPMYWCMLDKLLIF